MKSNFSFLKENKEYELFADACIDAENVASSAPALSVSGSRKALELSLMQSQKRFILEEIVLIRMLIACLI